MGRHTIANLVKLGTGIEPMRLAPAPQGDPAQLCPLDGFPTYPFEWDDLLICTRCNEMLTAEETVTKASPDTWAAYLLGGGSDTDPDDAPLARLLDSRT
jgi:hypothetical protein